MHQVNDTLRVKIHDLSRGGSGVARLETGEVVFIPFSVTGDELLIQIVKKEKKFSHGKILEILVPSEHRVTAPCKVFTVCGGCTWQHVAYPLQFETKKKGLVHALKRLGMEYSLDAVESFPAQNHYAYRNRIQLQGDSKTKRFGFYEKSSRTVVDISRCEITDERINAELPKLREEGFRTQSNPFTGGFKVEAEIFTDGVVRTAWNQKHAAFGFRQINDDQNEKLQAWVKDHAGSGGILLDLFGGDGNLSRGLASCFSAVHCVDLSSPTEKPLDLPSHYHFHRSDVLKWIQFQANPKKLPVTLILDPPREGMSRIFSDFWAELSSRHRPERILLVGCDVDAFSVDCQRFIQEGYQLKKLAALDLFPQTPHLESLALFTV